MRTARPPQKQNWNVGILPAKPTNNEKHSTTMNTMTVPAAGQLIVDVEDMSLSSYELALKDLDEGRVYDYESLDDLIKEIENGD